MLYNPMMANVPDLADFVDEASAIAAGYPGGLDEAVEQRFWGFAEAEGFRGIHIGPIAERWYNINSTTFNDGSSMTGRTVFDPQPDAFRAIANIAIRCQRNGHPPHLWPWGDGADNQAPQNFPGQENGIEHQRVNQMMATHFAAIPGMTFGYGYDNDEHVTPAQAATTFGYIQSFTTYPLDFEVRGATDEVAEQRSLDYAAAGTMASLELLFDEDRGIDTFDLCTLARTTFPTVRRYASDRFRHRPLDGAGKDFVLPQYADTIGICALTGGIAGIYGNLRNAGGQVSNFEGHQPFDAATRTSVVATRDFLEAQIKLPGVVDGSPRTNIVGNQIAAWDFGPFIIAQVSSAGAVSLNLGGLVSDGDWTRARIEHIDYRNAGTLTEIGVANLINRTVTLAAGSYFIKITNTTDPADLTDPPAVTAPDIVAFNSGQVPSNVASIQHPLPITLETGQAVLLCASCDESITSREVGFDTLYASPNNSVRSVVQQYVATGGETEITVSSRDATTSAGQPVSFFVLVLDKRAALDVAAVYNLETGDTGIASLGAITGASDATRYLGIAAIDDEFDAVVSTFPTGFPFTIEQNTDTTGSSGNGSAIAAISRVVASAGDTVPAVDIVFTKTDRNMTVALLLKAAP